MLLVKAKRCSKYGSNDRLSYSRNKKQWERLKHLFVCSVALSSTSKFRRVSCYIRQWFLRPLASISNRNQFKRTAKELRVVQLWVITITNHRNDSAFQLLQAASVLQISGCGRLLRVISPSGYKHSYIKMLTHRWSSSINGPCASLLIPSFLSVSLSMFDTWNTV